MDCIDMLVKISYHKKEKKIGKKLLVLSELHFHKHSYWTTHPFLHKSDLHLPIHSLMDLTLHKLHETLTSTKAGGCSCLAPHSKTST